MATVTDSIINIIIILAAVVALSIIVTSTVLKNTVTDVEQDRDVWLEERTNFAVEAIFDSTENVSGKPMKELISESIFTLRTELPYNDLVVDVPEETKLRMDTAFGKDMYFMRVEPVIQGINMAFVLDSSRTVEEERQEIADNLANIRQTLEDQITITGREKVTIQIYMLPTTGDSKCETFTSKNIPELRCIQLTEETLYRELILRDWERPGFRPGNTYENWVTENHVATPVDFAMSDWAAGVAAAVWEFKKDPFLQVQTSINMIFPLSDELSTTSKADSCFNRGDEARYFMCLLCDGNCPVGRSLDAVNQAIEMAVNSSSIVFPIYSVNCDYEYEPALNIISFNPDTYIQSFIDPPGTPFDESDYPGTTWCSQNACGGCTVDSDGQPPEPDFCFHNNCEQALRDQMQVMADSTGGRLFDINEAGEIPNNVLSAFDRVVANFNFVIGFQDESRDRFVYSKVIQLPNGALSKVEIWVYQDPPRKCTQPESCTTVIGCEGTRDCINMVDGLGDFSDTCVPIDPACTGAPCQTPQICVDADGCLGLQECIDDDGDGWGELSPECTKTDSSCEAPCIHNCMTEGEISCSETYEDSGVYWKLICVADENECLNWEPFRVCSEPCEDGVRCGEDPSCNLECSENNDCNEACSQNMLCPFDTDCDAPCAVGPACGDEGVCNLLCSPQYPGACPLDLDCPSCMNRAGDTCPTPPVNNCCQAGETFVWAQRYMYPPSSMSHCDRGTCYGQCVGEPPPFGMCCDGARDCVIYSGSPQCVDEGTQMNGIIRSDGSYLCVDQIMQPCALSPACASGQNPALCIPDVTINSVTWSCNPETGEWESE